MKTYYVYTRRDGFDVYEEALAGAGYRRTTDLNLTDFCFYDIENNEKKELIEFHKKKPIPLFIYPHSATSHIIWDGICTPLPVKANFVSGYGPKAVMVAYKYPHPVVVIGWTFSEILPFKPADKIRTILFAPMHGLKKKIYPKYEAEHNPIVLKQLLDLSDHYDKLIIRCGGLIKLHNFGNLLDHPKIELEIAILNKNDTIKSITNSDIDLVISKSTFGYTSVALGKPTLFYGEHLPIYERNKHAVNEKHYKNFRKFPVDFNGTWEQITRVAKYNQDIEEWKKLFIGKPFDKNLFLETIKMNIGE